MRARALAGVAFLAVAVTFVASLSAQEPAGFTGVFAVRGDEIIEAENADRLMTPASTQKLLVAALAFERLGPDYRIATRLVADGPLRPLPGGGLSLDGRLVVVAAGDPSFNRRHHPRDPREPLRLLAAQVAKAGIRRVEGELVVDASVFAGRERAADWSQGDLGFAWAAAPSALSIDENALIVHVAPGARVGQPARVSGPPEVEWVNRTVTAPAARDGRGSLEFVPIWGEPRVLVRGEYPMGEPSFTVRVTMPDPEQRAGEALSALLRDAGVEVAGPVRVAVAPVASPAAEPVAEVASPPLQELVAVMLQDSQNTYAEALLRVIAREVKGEGRPDLGLEALHDFLVEQVGIQEGAFELDDASGLSPGDLITPRALVDLLRWSWQRPWGGRLVDCLATRQKGTLVAWGSTPPMAAKTGTLRHTQTLAGLLLPAEPEPIFFAILLNHRREAGASLRSEIVRRLWAWRRRFPAPSTTNR